VKQTTSLLAVAAAASVFLAACAPIVNTLGALSGQPQPPPVGVLEVDVPYGVSAREVCFTADYPRLESLPNAATIRAAITAAGAEPPVDNAPALRLRLFAPGEDGRFPIGDSFTFRVTPKSLVWTVASVGRPYLVGTQSFVRQVAAGTREALSVDVAATASLELVVTSSEGRVGCFEVEVTRFR
jgi:hypothetical protein